MNTVEINKNKCEEIGKLIGQYSFLPEFFQRDFITVDCDPETKLRMYTYALAICHQTHTLINKKKNIKGWEYLEYVYTNLAKEKSKLLEPEYLVGISAEKLSNQLRPLFSDDGQPNNCTLDQIEERSNFIINIAQVLLEKYNGRITDIFEKSEYRLVNNNHGIYKLFEDFEAFRDPEKKKTTFICKFGQEAGILQIKDPQNFIIPMDYHIQRVLLRTGCVEINDENLRNKLFTKQKIDSDTEIRRASIEACKILADNADYDNPLLINDILWPLGRSCCKEKMLCIDGECNKSPCTLTKAIQLNDHKHCILSPACNGAQNPEYRKYWQPIVDTHFY